MSFNQVLGLCQSLFSVMQCIDKMVMDNNLTHIWNLHNLRVGIWKVQLYHNLLRDFFDDFFQLLHFSYSFSIHSRLSFSVVLLYSRRSWLPPGTLCSIPTTFITLTLLLLLLVCSSKFFLLLLISVFFWISWLAFAVKVPRPISKAFKFTSSLLVTVFLLRFSSF